MAHVMSGMPDVWRKVLAEHVPDQGGRCQACRDEGGFSASWPCLTRQIAEQAKQIHDDPLFKAPPLRSAPWNAEPDLDTAPPYSPETLEPADWPSRSAPLRSAGPKPLRNTGAAARRSTGPIPLRQTGPVPLRSTGPIPLRSTGRHAAP